jgi:hypothetical protein
VEIVKPEKNQQKKKELKPADFDEGIDFSSVHLLLHTY